MPHPAALIHPTALVSAKTVLAADVIVEAFAVLEGQVTLAPRCVIRSRAHLIGPLTIGSGSHVHSHAVIGDRPQHLCYRDEPTGVEVGNDNTFRENVTVHSGTGSPGRTVIGNHNCFMVGSHVAHDCQVGNRCTLGNNALLAGHCILEDDVSLGDGSAVHQHCRLGRLSVLREGSTSTLDVPPFIVQEQRNRVVGVNGEGMRRAGLTAEQINALHWVYGVVYLQGRVLSASLARVEEELGAVDVVREFVAFVRASKRGIKLVGGSGSVS
jgi:UDP-N-acetylglucosamine acyltransferase